MDWSKAGKILRGVCHRDDVAILSRRDALAGLGLVGLFLAAGPKLLTPAEAKPVDAPAVDTEAVADATRAEATETAQRDAGDSADVADLSAHRRRRRYWRRRYWRRRYWRHRHWRRRYWRRRHWRRRRYWY
jgi:hypothetical protein